MKQDSMLSGIVAVAFHLLILSGPLPGGGGVDADVYETISLSIIRPKPVVTDSSREEVPPLTKPQPQMPPKPKPACEQTPLPKKKEVHKKPVAIKPPIQETEVQVKKLKDVIETSVATPEPPKPFREKEPEPAQDSGVGKEPHGEGIEIKEGAALETASLDQNDSHDALQKQGTASGKGLARSIITKAIP